VFIGRNERRKGIEELTEVLTLLDDNFHFDFVGAIPENCRIKKNNRISYHGIIQDEKRIKEILRNADVLVCPSWSEGMPTVILEAIASGCAILATDVGAVSEIVNDTNGWLIRPGNKKELLQIMQQIIRMDEQKVKRKKEKSLHIARNFTWNEIIKKTIDELL
jgi:glycosyltransferase involved in cell wall biosynthesis